MDVEVAVQQHHVASCGCIESGAKGGPLAAVALADDGADLHMVVGRVDGGEARKDLVGAVPAAVVHRHKLCVDAVALEQIGNLHQVGFGLGRQLVERHDDGQPVVADRFAGKCPSFVYLRHL